MVGDVSRHWHGGLKASVPDGTQIELMNTLRMINTMTPIKLPDAPPLVTVTVNGKELQMPKGKNLLQALLDSGHYVPH